MNILLAWRTSNGDNQAEAALKLGINSKSYSYYERQKETPPKLLLHPEISEYTKKSGWDVREPAMGYTGPANQREPAAPALTPSDLAREMGALRGHLDARLEPLAEGIRALMELLDAEKRLRESGHGGRKENER